MIIVALILVGLALGSFVNALVWRIHEQDKKKNKHKAELSIMKGRSMCPHCKHVLGAADLIPVISWLSLRGKCRYCHRAISWQYPVVELLTAMLFMVSYLAWPFVFDGAGSLFFGFWLIFLTGSIALLIYDLKWFLLPNRIVIPLVALGVLQWLIMFALFGGRISTIWDVAASVLIGGGIFYVLFQVSKGKWIGGGDVKLGFLIGLALGSGSKSLLMLFLASLLGTLVVLPLLAAHKIQRSTRVPFGPFLITAAIIAQLAGLAIINWYQQDLLLMG